MKSFFKTAFLLVATFSFLFFSNRVLAISINLPYSLSNELGVEIIPEYPRPNEQVWVNLTLYTDNLNSANISWYIDDKLVEYGIGLTSYSFKMGEAGVGKKVTIKVVLANGASFTKEISLTPSSVDLIWEALSYTPPFYKGRALHPAQGIVKVVAMPEFYKDGSRVKPENLIYNWSNDVEAYQSQSGYGKNVLLINGSLIGDIDSINLLVTDPGKGLAAQNSISINPSDSSIVFYKNDPYYGFSLDKALFGTYNLKEEEVELFAAPYNMSPESSTNLEYSWSLNGTQINSLNGSRTALFKKTEEEGSSELLFRATNNNRILQFTENSLVIRFSK